MFRNVIFLAMLVAVPSTATIEAQQLPEGLKCVVATDKAATSEASADYRDGKVFFCCDECAKSFTEDNSKYSTLANQQLVLTGQFEQTSCPVASGDVNKEAFIEIDGVKVYLCCEKCKAAIEAEADDEAKRALVFADEVFEKSFAKKPSWDLTDVKCFIIPKRDVKESKVVDHLDGKVFFCCPGCVSKWKKTPEKFTAVANLQLVQTGQYQQTKCPISGGDLDDEQVAEVDGQKVKFCCEHCVGKVAAASTDEAKRELVFGEKRFAKGFEKK